MTPSVSVAIEGLKRAFPAATVSVLSEDGQGGAFVVLDGLELGPRFSPTVTWFGAHLPATLPYADIYPLFIGGDVRRHDGGGLQGPVSAMQWQNRSALQVSRRNNRIGAGHTAASKFLKVLDFVKGLA